MPLTLSLPFVMGIQITTQQGVASVQLAANISSDPLYTRTLYGVWHNMAEISASRILME